MNNFIDYGRLHIEHIWPDLWSWNSFIDLVFRKILIEPNLDLTLIIKANTVFTYYNWAKFVEKCLKAQQGFPEHVQSELQFQVDNFS